MKMLVRRLFFTLLPAFAFSTIDVKIKVDKGNDAVDLRGSEVNVISESERKTFQIDDTNLKKMSGEYFDKACDEVFIRDPTVLGDVYSEYGLEVVKRTLKPYRSRFLGVNAKPVAVNKVEYINRSSHNATYSTSVTQQIEESISHSFSSGGELTVGQEIRYDLNFGVASAGGGNTLTYTSTWNEETTQSRTVTVGTTSSVLVTIPPKSTVIALLTCTQGKLIIAIDYIAKIDGNILCRYEDVNRDAYVIEVNKILNKLNKTQYIYSTETLEIGFYSNCQVELIDGEDNKMVEQEGAMLSQGHQMTKG